MRNQIQPNDSGSNGPYHPPRYRFVATAETVTMFTYSARKNSAKLMLEYSVWYPATSSCSASGKSNGARLVSAMPAVMKMKKPIGCTNTNQRGATGTPKRCQYPAWAVTDCCSDSVVGMSSTAASARP